jgi:hypothetical protein
LHLLFPPRAELLGHNLGDFRRVTGSLLIGRLHSYLTVGSHNRLLDWRQLDFRPFERGLHDVKALSIKGALNILSTLSLSASDILPPPALHVRNLAGAGKGSRKLLSRGNRARVNNRTIVNLVSGWHG